MSIPAKKRKYPKKQKKQPNETGGPVFIFTVACQGGRLAPLPPVSYATADKARCSEASRFSITKIWYAAYFEQTMNANVKRIEIPLNNCHAATAYQMLIISKWCIRRPAVACLWSYSPFIDSLPSTAK